MPFTVTQRKRGGFEFTSVAETQSAALVLAQMMRRAGEEYCAESMVTVRDGGGLVVSAWRGGNLGWQPIPQSRPPIPAPPPFQPLSTPPPMPAVPAPRRSSGRFARLPTEPMPGSQVSMSRSYASVSITEYSAV